jgi:uncharacterized membrane protein YqhA
MSVVVVISQHLLNVFVQLANKRGLKKKKMFKYFAAKSYPYLTGNILRLHYESNKLMLSIGL